MVVKNLKYGKSDTPRWNEHFGNRTWARSLILFSLNMFVTFKVGSICPLTNLLVIWNLMTAKNRRLILHKSFRSNLKIIRVNSVMKYVGLQQVWEGIWNLTAKIFFMLFTYVAGLAKMNLARGATCASTGTFYEIEKIVFFCNEVVYTTYISVDVF